MRTFTKTLMAFALIGFLMTSCGGGSEVCGCADTMLAMMKEAKGNMNDKDKMEALKKKYEAKIEKCEKMSEGKSDEEKKKMEEEMKNFAIHEAEKALDASSSEKLVASYMKSTFEKRYKGVWHCIAGRNFGGYVTHET